MEVEDGKLALTAALALSTSGLLANGACLLPFLVLKQRIAEPSFLFVVGPSYVWPALHSGSAQGHLWRALYGCSVLGAGGEGRFCLQARPGIWGPSALEEGVEKMHLEALLGCKRSFRPCSCSRRSPCSQLV